MKMADFFLKLTRTISILCHIFCGEYAYSSFYNEHAKGWFWYEDPRIKKEQNRDKKRKEKEQTVILSSLKKAQEDLKAYKEKLEGTKALALMQPTFVNVKNYMTLQKDMSDRAEQFSQAWQQVVLKTPVLNPEIKNPTAQYLRHVKQDEMQKHHEGLLKKAAKTYGLFLFVSHACSYCKAFAPIVKQFAHHFGFEVMVISLHGKVDQEIEDAFDNIKPNNGMAESFGITQAPALMAYNPQTEDIVPIAYGATSMDRLTENFITLIKGEADV